MQVGQTEATKASAKAAAAGPAPMRLRLGADFGGGAPARRFRPDFRGQQYSMFDTYWKCHIRT